MSRLPTPGGDDGNWGDILNDFLGQSLNADGTIKPSQLSAAGGEVVAHKGQPSGYAPLDISGKVPSANLPATTTPDATNISKGIIQLTGDLSGTAASPTVPGLSGKIDNSIVTAKGDLLAATASASLSRLGVSTDGFVLTADSTQTTGLIWAPTGADSTAVHKGDLVFNVKDYGAIGDGTADDTAAIQAAINAVPAGGGTVYMPAGRYKVTSSLNITKDNTTFIGAGTGQRTGATQTGNGTRIEAGGSISGQVILVDNGSGTTPVYGVQLRDFTIDGQLAGIGVDGIVLRSNRSHTQHVHIHKMSGNGMRLYGYASPTFNTYDSIVAFCQFGDNASAGFVFDSNSADCHMTSCILYNNDINILIKSASQQITACHTYNATTDNIKFDGGGSRTKIINCKIEGAGQNGINIDSTNGGFSDIQITGNGLSTNGDSAVNTYDHIVIQGPSGNGVTRTIIVGNSFGNKTSQNPTNIARYGVNLSSSCAQGAVVIGNSFGPSSTFNVGTSQFGTGPINNNGSTTIPGIIRANANAADDPGRDFINVMDAPYLARGTGSTDDTAAIQSALNAVPSTGGIVYLPPGKYKITTPLIIQTDNTLLMGAGAGNRSSGTQVGAGSRLEADAAFAGSAMVLVQRPALDRTVYGVKMQDIAIDGKSIGSNIDGIHWEVVRGELVNVAVHLCTGNGVNVVGYTSWHATDNRFIGCDFSYNSLAGLTYGANADYNKLIGCILSNNTQDGLYTAAVGVLCESCDFYSNSRYGLYLDGGGSRSNFTGCKFRLNLQHGVFIDSTNGALSDIAFSGCTFATNGISATNTYSNVCHAGPSGNALSRVVYAGNNFLYVSGDSANKPQYGLNFSTSSTQFAVVEGNAFGPASHWGTAAIKDSSSSTNPAKIRNNVGWITEANGVATVAATTTSIVVTHGLSVTPTSKDIHVTPTDNMGAATKFWVTNVTATQFTIQLDQTPGAATTSTFAWQALRLS